MKEVKRCLEIMSFVGLYIESVHKMYKNLLLCKYVCTYLFICNVSVICDTSPATCYLLIM